MEWTINKSVSFTYKGGRKVKGKIYSFNKRTVFITLDNDYIGKNNEWFRGEVKGFNIKEIKNHKSITWI